MPRTRSRHAALIDLGAVVAGLGTVTYFYQRDIQHARERVRPHVVQDRQRRACHARILRTLLV